MRQLARFWHEEEGHDETEKGHASLNPIDDSPTGEGHNDGSRQRR